MKKLFAAFCASALILGQSSMLPVGATSVSEQITEPVESESVKATYLISSKSLAVSNKNGQLCINGSTVGVTTMKSIGFVNIDVERSSNGVSGWSHAYDVDDVLNTDVSRCDFNNKKVNVASGYYYRVVLDHYAKETGWFPRTQSEGNTSNVVFIS